MMQKFQALPVFQNPVFRKVLYAHWTLLLIALIFSTLALRFAPFNLAAPQIGGSVCVIGVMAALSIYMPMERGQWGRLLYLAFEIFLISAASVMGIARFLVPLYMIVAAKSTLMLTNAGICLTLVLSFASLIVCSAWKLRITEAVYQTHALYSPELLGSSLILNISTGALMIVVALLTRTLINEQDLRLEQIRLSAEVEELATQLERTRIAREIHDSLGHTLTSLKIQLEVSRKFGERDQKKAQEALTIAEELASRSLTDVHAALQSIRRGNFSLRDATTELIKEAQTGGVLSVAVNDPIPDVDPVLGYQLFRIVQEAMTNTLKHAQASELSINIEQLENQIRVLIADNGRGLTNGGKSDGFGLTGMKERISGLGGTIDIATRDGGGTQICVIVPHGLKGVLKP